MTAVFPQRWIKNMYRKINHLPLRELEEGYYLAQSIKTWFPKWIKNAAAVSSKVCWPNAMQMLKLRQSDANTNRRSITVFIIFNIKWNQTENYLWLLALMLCWLWLCGLFKATAVQETAKKKTKQTFIHGMKLSKAQYCHVFSLKYNKGLTAGKSLWCCFSNFLEVSVSCTNVRRDNSAC